MEIILFVHQMLWVLAVVFSVFEFGEQMGGTVDEINDMYEQFHWYLFPKEVQQILTTLIIFAQKPMEIRIIGSITCGRITFKNVSADISFPQKTRHTIPARN